MLCVLETLRFSAGEKLRMSIFIFLVMFMWYPVDSAVNMQ